MDGISRRAKQHIVLHSTHPHYSVVIVAKLMLEVLLFLRKPRVHNDTVARFLASLIRHGCEELIGLAE